MLVKFKVFEKAKVSIEDNGCAMESVFENERVDEGVFSDIVNYFSRVLGGKVGKLDKLVNRYKNNEEEYWPKWADANFKYNEADSLIKQTSDPAEKSKYQEMRERADKLLTQVDKGRDEVNDSLVRQAQHVIKNNGRLKDYYLMIKAKADEEVANENYRKLKKLSDKETVETLYKKMEADTENARTKEQQFKKKYGEQVSTTLPVSKVHPKDDKKAVPFKDYGITSLSDFVLSYDKVFDAKVAEMNQANLRQLVDYMKKEIQSFQDSVDKEIKGYQNELKAISPSATDVKEKRAELAKNMQDAQKSAEDDIQVLKDRISKIENKMLVG